MKQQIIRDINTVKSRPTSSLTLRWLAVDGKIPQTIRNCHIQKINLSSENTQSQIENPNDDNTKEAQERSKDQKDDEHSNEDEDSPLDRNAFLVKIGNSGLLSKVHFHQ